MYVLLQQYPYIITYIFFAPLKIMTNQKIHVFQGQLIHLSFVLGSFEKVFPFVPPIN